MDWFKATYEKYFVKNEDLAFDFWLDTYNNASFSSRVNYLMNTTFHCLGDNSIEDRTCLHINAEREIYLVVIVVILAIALIILISYYFSRSTRVDAVAEQIALLFMNISSQSS